MSEVRDQKTEVRSQKSEVRSQRLLNSEVGMRNAENLRIADRIRIDRIPSFDIRPARFH
jgi:hypothetical protein